MDQTICPSHTSRHHHDDAPFAEERDRYLRHCAKHGATPGSLTIKRNELVWIAIRLEPDARKGVGIEVLQRSANERQSLRGAVTAARRRRVAIRKGFRKRWAAWESGEDGISLISLGRDPSPRRKRPGR